MGAKKIRQTIEQYLDGASFVLDQSRHGFLGRLGSDDLRHFVKFPKYLDAAELKPLARVDNARRLVALVGCRAKVLAAARAALKKKEYAWSAKLANQVYLIDNPDEDARRPWPRTSRGAARRCLVPIRSERSIPAPGTISVSLPRTTNAQGC